GGRGVAVSVLSASASAIGLWGNTWGINQQLLNVIISRCFLGRHGYGAQEDTINRHDGQTVLGGPGTGQVFRCAVWGVDAATNSDGQVVVLTGRCVGSQQHFIQIHPGVVATSVAVFNLDDDAVGGVIRCDSDAVLNLLGGARLERDVWEAIGGELVQQFLGFIQLWDTSGDGHAGKLSTISACLGNNAGDTEL